MPVTHALSDLKKMMFTCNRSTLLPHIIDIFYSLYRLEGDPETLREARFSSMFVLYIVKLTQVSVEPFESCSRLFVSQKIL